MQQWYYAERCGEAPFLEFLEVWKTFLLSFFSFQLQLDCNWHDLIYVSNWSVLKVLVLHGSNGNHLTVYKQIIITEY